MPPRLGLPSHYQTTLRALQKANLSLQSLYLALRREATVQAKSGIPCA